MKKKRLLSLILVISMLVSLLPSMNVFADNSDLDNTKLSGIIIQTKTATTTWATKELSPNFEPTTRNYTLDLDIEESSIYLKLHKGVNGQTAKASIEGKDCPLNDEERYFEIVPFNLTKAISVFAITITSKDGSTSESYKITIKRGDPTPRILNVINGKPTNGCYLGGDRVTITADPAEQGKKFSKWVSDDAEMIKLSPYQPTTNIVMPNKDVMVRGTCQYDPDTDNTLSDIRIRLWDDSPGFKTWETIPLTPNFDPEIEDYTVEVTRKYTRISIGDGGVATPYFFTTKAHTEAIFNINGSSLYNTNEYGIPEDAEETLLQVVVQNKNSGGEVRDYKVKIVYKDTYTQPKILGEEKLPDGMVGVPYTYNLSASGTFKKESPITWEIVEGSLPSGLRLEGNTIKGTPDSGGYKSFKVKASYAHGQDIADKSIEILSPDPILLGIVNISGEERFGKTLTCSVEKGNTDEFIYKWKRGSGAIGNGPTYKLKPEDIGQRLTCEVTSNDPNKKGSLIGATSGPILKENGPEAPTGLMPMKYISLGHEYYTIDGTTGAMEYADNIDFTDPIGCDLDQTEVDKGTYYVRYKATNTHNVGKYTQIVVVDELDPTTVSISPATASLQKGRSQQFEASVIGPYDQVYWSVSGKQSYHTEIDNSGMLTLGPDESAENLVVKVSSRYDGSKSAIAKVNVTNAARKYILTIINGTDAKSSPQDKDYKEGEIAIVKADDIAGKEFVEWTSPDMDIHEDYASDPDWSFLMPSKNVILVANYKNSSGPAQEKLTGTVSISGEAKMGQTLIATVSDSNSSIEDLSYKWITYGIVSSYPSFEIDETPGMGYVVCCEITSSTHSGSIIGIAGIYGKDKGPEAPENLIGQSPTSLEGTDGKIIGTTNEMEYADNIYFTDAIDCEADQIQGLAAGTYYVRYKETNSKDAGDYAKVIIRAFNTPDDLIYIEDLNTNAEDFFNTIPTVKISKIWNVKFNDVVEPSTINENGVHVWDNTNMEFVDIIVQRDETEKRIISVKPLDYYLSNNQYTLYITQNIESVNGETLKRVIKMEFSTSP